MFRSLRLKNFKGWRDTGDIELRPITVFFGSNSSGKTSLLQSLLLMKQTIDSPDRKRVLHLGDSKTPIDLGTFEDVIHKHQKDQELGLEFSWDLPTPIEIHDSVNDVSYVGDVIDFEVEIVRTDDDHSRLVVDRMNYTLGPDSEPLLGAGMVRTKDGPRPYDLELDSYDVKWQPGRRWSFPAPTRFYGFPNETVARGQNTNFLADLNLELENEFQRLYYLGPLREDPRRFYTWAGEEHEHVGWRGEHAVEAILAARGREISRGPNKRYKSFEEVIARWLETMKLIREFKVEELVDGGRQYRVRVRTTGSSDFVDLPDVGFGVSQVLPVVVACFYASRDSTVLLEQPEIHLHPQVQATLADLFIEAIRSRQRDETGSYDRNVQLIVESHSEYFLHRLQRRIAEEAISEQDVAIYFCDAPRGVSKIERLELDPYGNIKNWPEGFFGDEMNDLAKMARAELERRQEGK